MKLANIVRRLLKEEFYPPSMENVPYESGKLESFILNWLDKNSTPEMDRKAERLGVKEFSRMLAKKLKIPESSMVTIQTAVSRYFGI